MNQDELDKKAEILETVYEYYLAELNKIKLTQEHVLSDFLHQIEEAKIKKIKEQL